MTETQALRIFGVPFHVFGSSHHQLSIAEDLVVKGYAGDHSGRIDSHVVFRLREMFDD